MLDQLCDLSWLPAKNRFTAWFKPQEIFASYREHLFYTQADFPDVPQRNIPTKFHNYLGIRLEPTTDVVVKHLLEMSRRDESVHPEVYTFLEQHVEHPAITALIGKNSLIMRDDQGRETYVEPKRVFWGAHPFGPYRYQLSPEMRAYSKLLTKLGVQEYPAPEDAAQVLLEASDKYRNQELKDGAEAIVYSCWGLLRDAESQTLSLLGNRSVIPNNRGLLEKPVAVFFDDRPKIAELLGLNNSVIPRPQDVWKVMREVRVRNFSEVLHTELLEAVDPESDQELTNIIRERTECIFRIIEAQLPDNEEGWNEDLLAELTVESLGSLTLEYSIESPMKRRQAQASAYYEPEGKTLYYVRGAGRPNVSIARELAHALVPQVDPGSISLSVKEILSAESTQEAISVLNEAGFTVTSLAQQDDSVESTVFDLGGKELQLDIEAPANSDDTSAVNDSSPAGVISGATGDSTRQDEVERQFTETPPLDPSERAPYSHGTDALTG